MNELIEQLITGVHPIAIREPWVEDLLDRLKESSYLQITFTRVDGARELGVDLDHKDCDSTTADFEGRKGEVHLEGTVVLDHQTFRCVAYIDLSTMDGTGYLVLVEEPRQRQLPQSTVG
jgi:hypothetical protein